MGRAPTRRKRAPTRSAVADADAAADTNQPSRLTRHMSAHAAADLPAEGYLIDCEKLKPTPACDTIYLSQIIPLIRRRPFACEYEPVTVPTIELGKLCPIVLKPGKYRELLWSLDLAADPAIVKVGVSYGEIARAYRKVRSERGKAAGDPARPPRPEAKLREAIAEHLRERHAAQTKTMGPPMPMMMQPHFHVGATPVSSAFDSIAAAVEDAISKLPLPLPAEARAGIGFEAVYRQTWCVKAYRRGRLLRSIPLAAEGQKEITVKSWTIRKERRQEVESIERDISTEIVGDEKWSHATSKQLSTELNQTVDANLKAGAQVPVKGVTVGAEAGAGSKTSGSVSNTITETEEKVRQATVKAADTLRTKFSSTVETEAETGFESVVKEVIVNPNKCRTLTYHFFEVSEVYDVTTQLDALRPVLLLPLRRPAVTPEWLLCNECLLRQHLPCETFFAGFDAAKLVLGRRLLGEFLGSYDDPAIKETAEALLVAMRDVVNRYRSLRDATPNVTANSGSNGGNLIDQGMGVLEDLVDAGKDLFDTAADTAEEFWDKAADAVGDVLDGIASLVESTGIGWPFSAQMAPTGAIAFQAAPYAPGGIGSYIYWRVADTVAPELGTACAGLAAALQNIEQMPTGPTKITALMGALETFFQTLGDVDDVFRRIDTGLAVLAIVAIGTGLVTGAALATLLAIKGGMTIALAAAILGTMMVGTLTTVGTYIAIVIAQQQTDVDILPNDQGLKASIGALYGMAQQLGNATDAPPPPMADDPAERAAYQQALMEAKQRRREMAEAQVELERLICHISSNISYYTEVYWTAKSSADLARLLEEEFKIPPHVFEPRIVGFRNDNAAVPVSDARWLKVSGIDIEKALKELDELGLVERETTATEITMPTPGVTVEPEIGACTACDDFIQFHRERDQEIKTEEVTQAQLETQRLQERLDHGLLDHPSPFASAKSLTVNLTVKGGADGDGGGDDGQDDPG